MNVDADSSRPDHAQAPYADSDDVRVGLNLREGQRLLIIGPLANGGVSLDAAPFVRDVAASAYRAGAPLVEALWGDEAMQLARFAQRVARVVQRVSRPGSRRR